MSNEGHRIVCMQHCSSEFSIFFTDFPSKCPICGVVLEKCQLLIPPFCVPSPFSSSDRSRCCVLVKPTNGDFLVDYTNGDNLHLGIADSNGLVYNYDEQGLHVDKTGWDQTAVLNFSYQVPDWDSWDAVLKSSLTSENWAPQRYHEERHNCYDYVLMLLNQLSVLQSSCHQNYSRVNFCRHFVLPVTSKIAKYIDLYRKIKLKGVMVQSSSSVL